MVSLESGLVTEADEMGPSVLKIEMVSLECGLVTETDEMGPSVLEIESLEGGLVTETDEMGPSVFKELDDCIGLQLVIVCDDGNILGLLGMMTLS